MSVNLINIAGIGLSSSMGGYQDACAAYRAGLNRFAAHDYMKLMFPGGDEPDPLTVAGVSTLYGYEGIGRTIKMFQQAYRDLQHNLTSPLPENLAILMALPEPEDREIELNVAWNAPREEKLQCYLDSLLPNLFNQLNSAFHQAPLQTVFGDRLAFARILQKAQDILENGDIEHCLLMVADSLLGKEDLEAQLEYSMLKTAANPVGYIPGEGAALILVSREAEKGTLPISVQVLMDRETVDPEDEDAEREAWLGKKLFALYKQLLPQELSYYPQFIMDLNGEENRAQEFGMLQVMLKSRYLNVPLPEEQIPALGFGEVGTMMGPIAFASIVASIQRRYARQRNFLISLSEDSGRRALIYIKV